MVKAIPHEELITIEFFMNHLPNIVGHRLVRELVKRADLGLSSEEMKEIEDFYNRGQTWQINNQVAQRLQEILSLIMAGRVDAVITKVSLLAAEIKEHKITCTTRKDPTKDSKIEKLKKLLDDQRKYCIQKINEDSPDQDKLKGGLYILDIVDELMFQNKPKIKTEPGI